MKGVSSSYSTNTLLVRVTRGGRRPHLSFYLPDYTRVLQLQVRYLGWRTATKDERNIIRNFHPDIILDPARKQAFANYGRLEPTQRLPRPRAAKPGPEYREPIVGFRYTIRYLDDRGQTRRARLLYQFFDKESLHRFRQLMRSGRLPVPLAGTAVNFGIEPWLYRVRPFATKQYLGGGS